MLLENKEKRTRKNRDRGPLGEIACDYLTQRT